MERGDVTIPVSLPADAGQEPPVELAERLRLLWVLDEVRLGRMTRMRAARVLHMSIDAFLREADGHGVPAIDYDPGDLASELSEP